ncbi:metallophosphoesterase 1-like [Osmerus mordax]|uniref:metallophosphoesterase 1-like n=1 Tax=Osmerus mordax TaxID=8014 RepID=UPI00350FCBBF
MTALSSRCRWCFTLALVMCLCCVIIFCEYLIYYPAIWRCAWPGLDGNGAGQDKPLLAMFLSDTHLLGAVKGHWLDKIRREWQMERSFQTAVSVLHPEMVFILGDIFDEGKWSTPENWQEDVRRFNHIFRHPNNTELIGIIGNHDIGFHHEMSWSKLERFEKVFNFTSASVITRKAVNFILVNSMALHGDHCPICQAVETQLYRISQALNCSAQPLHTRMRRHCQDVQLFPATAPIILQHYPLYRVSDAMCKGTDAALPEERHLLFEERYDVLSQEASNKLLWWFQPRLILSGHTHSACKVVHDNSYPEISVPSFSWRNRNNPSFILGSFSPSAFQLTKCFLPEESSVLGIYCGTALLVTLLLLLIHLPLLGPVHISSTTTLLAKYKAL